MWQLGATNYGKRIQWLVQKPGQGNLRWRATHGEAAKNQWPVPSDASCPRGSRRAPRPRRRARPESTGRKRTHSPATTTPAQVTAFRCTTRGAAASPDKVTVPGSSTAALGAARENIGRFLPPLKAHQRSEMRRHWPVALFATTSLIKLYANGFYPAASHVGGQRID